MAPLWSDFKQLLPNYWQHIINLMMLVPVYSATSYIQYNSWMSWEWIVLQFGEWLTAEEITHQCLNSNERTWRRGTAKTESATIHNKTFSLKDSDDCSLKGLLCKRRDYIPFVTETDLELTVAMIKSSIKILLGPHMLYPVGLQFGWLIIATCVSQKQI